MCTLIMRRAHPREPTTVIRQTTHYIVRNDAFTDRLERESVITDYPL